MIDMNVDRRVVAFLRSKRGKGKYSVDGESYPSKKEWLGVLVVLGLCLVGMFLFSVGE